jgi:hypothetical protein
MQRLANNRLCRLRSRKGAEPQVLTTRSEKNHLLQSISALIVSLEGKQPVRDVVFQTDQNPRV